MLAMEARTTRASRLPALSLTTIASMLAPTGGIQEFVENNIPKRPKCDIKPLQIVVLSRF